MIRLFLTSAIVIMGLVAYFTPAGVRTRWGYVLKLLVMLAIIGVAWTGWRPDCPYCRLILNGLLFSLVGDILLMLPSDLFIPGLLAFLGAHISYIAAFTSQHPTGVWSWLVLLIIAAYAGFFYWIFRHQMSADRRSYLPIAIGVYCAALTLMVWRALMHGNPVASAGGLLFLISDSLLGWNRFVSPFRWAEIAIMSTYVAAQYLLALSLS